MGRKNISAPGVAFTAGGGSPAANAQMGAEPFICFPFFDVGYHPDFEGTFLDLYECSGLNKPHAFWEYARCETAFASFKNAAGLYMKPGDAQFWERVMQTQAESLVVLDVNFDAYNLSRLLDVLGSRQFKTELIVTVFTAGGDSATTIRENKNDLLEMIKMLDDTYVEVLELSGENAKYVHDRFALVDNCIWHFGAAVGGMHDKIHAYSGPWNDVGQAFKSLTDELRNGAKPIIEIER